MTAVLCVAMSAALSAWLLLPPGRDASPLEFPAPKGIEDPVATPSERDDALRRAKVWRPVDTSTIDLAANPPDPSGRLSEPIVRPPGAGSTAANCSQPFAFIQDLGAPFGPNKVDLDQWERVPIWADAAQCLVSMQRLPFRGGTFPDARISEEGRQLLSRGLAELTDERIAALFSSARFHEFRGMAGMGNAHDVRDWTRVFRDKLRQITERGPCPSSSTIEPQSARSSETSPALR